jgi:hypothetical protein
VTRLNPRIAVPLLLAVAAAGILLVVFGGRSSGHGERASNTRPTSTTTGPTTSAPELGDFPTGAELNRAVAALDPATLRPRTGGPDKSVRLPVATVDRCAEVLPHASVDRGISTRRAVAAAAIAGRPVIVYSYDAAATEKLPPGLRIFVVDRASCAIEYAQDH